MLKDILEVHFDKWRRDSGIAEKNYFLLLDDDKLNDFVEKRKHLMNSKHLEYIERIRNGFCGYFEVLDAFDNKLKIKNLLNNEVYEVYSKLKPIKYDILISRIYEFEGNFHLVDELSVTCPYFSIKYIHLNESPFTNYLNITNMEFEGKKCWDGFIYRSYVFAGKILDVKKFQKFARRSECFALISEDNPLEGIMILLTGLLPRNIKRMPVSPDDDITSLEIGAMKIIENMVVFAFTNINIAKTFLELLGDIYKIEKIWTGDENYQVSNLIDEFNKEFKENAIFEFYQSKKDYSENEFKFYYNLEAHFKKIGALNFFHIFEKNG